MDWGSTTVYGFLSVLLLLYLINTLRMLSAQEEAINQLESSIEEMKQAVITARWSKLGQERGLSLTQPLICLSQNSASLLGLH